jgi:CRP-like cAMP-binding protein
VEIPFPQRVVHRAPPLAPAPQLEAVTRALAACPTFASLPEQLLHALARNSRLVTFAPGEILVEEGEASEALFVIAAGRARVVRQGEEVATLGPGEHFGEIAFLTGQPRAASVVAQETLEAVEVDTQALRTALEEQPALAEELAQRVAARSAELSRRQELLEAASSQALKSTLLTRLRRLVGGN